MDILSVVSGDNDDEFEQSWFYEFSGATQPLLEKMTFEKVSPISTISQ